MTIKKILVIRFRRVGDAVLSVSLCTSLRKSFPEAEIHYVLNESIAPFFEGHPDIDKIITFSNPDTDKIYRYLGKVRQIMKEGKYDIIIDTRATMKTLAFSLFSLKSPYRIGRKKAYNHLIHNYRIDNYPDGKRDNVTLTLELLTPLSKHFNVIKDNNFRLYVSEEEKKAFTVYMESKGINFKKPIIICAVTARVESKIWDKQYMKKTLLHILDKYQNAQLIFNYGGEAEKASAYSLFNEMGKPPQVFIDIEAKSPKELKALISLSNFFFGNEGGPRHIAQSLDIPAFAIYSPNTTNINKTTWLPQPSSRNQGISLPDINPEAAKNNNLTAREKFDLIDMESVWKILDEMLTNNVI